VYVSLETSVGERTSRRTRVRVKPDADFFAEIRLCWRSLHRLGASGRPGSPGRRVTGEYIVELVPDHSREGCFVTRSGCSQRSQTAY
jgi:hypothetical protein